MDGEQRTNEGKISRRALSRRLFLKAVGAVAPMTVLAACGAGAPSVASTAAPAEVAPTTAPTEAAAPAATTVPPEAATAVPTEAAASGATAAPTEAASETVAPEPTAQGITTEGSKGQLLVAYRADANDSFKTVIERFTEETGIGVKHEVGPADYLTWQQLMTTRLASGDATVDVFGADDFMAAIYGSAGWLMELDPIVEQHQIDLNDWPKTLVTDVSRWDGKLYRLPWVNDTEICFYRTDFFEEAGVEPPTTWAELLDVATKLTKGTERYGIALAGAKVGTLGNDIQHWANQAGGAIDRLDDPGSREALVFYKDLFATHKVAPASTPQEDYGTILQGFLDNRYAMWWCWDGFLGAFRTNEEFWKGQVSAFLPPMGPKNAQTMTGCGGWSISNYSAKKDLATQWIEFTARPEIMKLVILRGQVPARMSLWSDAEVQDKAPSSVFLEQLAQAGDDLVKARPVTPSIQEIYDAAEQAIHAYLTDQMDVDTAIKTAMDRINPIKERDRQQT